MSKEIDNWLQDTLMIQCSEEEGGRWGGGGRGGVMSRNSWIQMSLPCSESWPRGRWRRAVMYIIYTLYWLQYMSVYLSLSLSLSLWGHHRHIWTELSCASKLGWLCFKCYFRSRCTWHEFHCTKLNCFPMEDLSNLSLIPWSLDIQFFISFHTEQYNWINGFIYVPWQYKINKFSFSLLYISNRHNFICINLHPWGMFIQQRARVLGWVLIVHNYPVFSLTRTIQSCIEGAPHTHTLTHKREAIYYLPRLMLLPCLIQIFDQLTDTHTHTHTYMAHIYTHTSTPSPCILFFSAFWCMQLITRTEALLITDDTLHQM